jgi:methionyl aminopeptidase
MTVKIHNQEDFAKMRKAGKLACDVLDYITDFVRVDVSTNELDMLCSKKILEAGAVCAPLNYHPSNFKYPYPKSICTSINEVICHGVPNQRLLKNGDIVNIDVTVILDGWHGDSSRMYYVGEPSIKAQKLTRVTYECLMLGIQEVKPGNFLGDIGFAIQNHAEKNGFSVVRDYCGHGIGKVFHDEPSVVHYGKKGQGLELKEGMFFTIEPMINEGSYHCKKDESLKNKNPVEYEWTVITSDKNPISGKRSLSAQFEHTIGVTSNGYEIFTSSPSTIEMPVIKQITKKN